MFLSKRPSGVWHVFYTDEVGKRKSVSTQSTRKSDALRFLQSFNLEQQRRIKRHQRLGLSEFVPAFIQHSKGIHTPKTTRSHLTALNEFQRAVGDIPLHKVGVREIEIFLSKKRAEASIWTAQKYYLALSSSFEAAVRWGHILRNPFRSVQKPKVPELLPVFLSKSEFRTLMGAISEEYLRELVYFAVCTGMRQGEILSLRWPQVDLSRRVITVSSSQAFITKNKRARVIPMTVGLLMMLAERRDQVTSQSDPVFQVDGLPLKADRVTKAFKRAVRSAGLSERIHFHTLRHTFASWLAQDGVSLFAIQKLLGHSSANVTQIYSHLQPDQMHDTVNRLAITLN
jgi:integrase